MTGQKTYRSNSIKSVSENSRKSSTDTDVSLDNDTNYEVDDLIKYSARKLSIFPLRQPKKERTILDDYEYFMNKKECDYGVCQCCEQEKPAKTTWQSIEEIIENDPEIIFDADDNPIVVKPIRKAVSMTELDSFGDSDDVEWKKKVKFQKNPDIFQGIFSKMADKEFEVK